MASTVYKAKVYRKPTNPFIGKMAKKLYALEEKRDESFKAATEELGKLVGLTEFWTEMLPEGIASMLDHWDHRASEIACVAFLEKAGYTVTAPEGPCV